MGFEAFRARVGQNIKKARWLAGLTQEQVEGVTLRYYQDLERGKRNATLEMLYMLAKQFRVTVADLVDVAGERPSSVRLADTQAEPPRTGRKPRATFR